MRNLSRICIVLVALLVFAPPLFSTHWAWDGIPVCDYNSTKGNQRIASDGSGGAFVVWEDSRTGNDDIFIQRIDSTGAPLWTVDGVRATTSTTIDMVPRVISDGAGGAIVAWGNDAVLAQRLDPGGTLLWGDEGVLVSDAASYQRTPYLVSDGKGGAIVAWIDFRSGNYDIYAQRIRADGVPLWTTNGVAVCSDGSHQWDPVTVGDDCGGAIIVWRDERPAAYSDIYAQRIDSTGAALWTADGIALCSDAKNQGGHDAATDMAGGAIVCWHTGDGSAPSRDVYAQKVDESGALLWGTGGVVVCADTMGQERPRIATDGAGGAIVAWYDYRSCIYNYYSDVYAQRLSSGGICLWASCGVPVCTAPNPQTAVEIAPNGTGGAGIVWEDGRFSERESCIFGEIVDADGTCLWGASGFPVCIDYDRQQWPRVASDGRGGGIFIWHDMRGGSDVYAQRLNLSFGPLSGDETPPVRRAFLAQNVPNPFNPGTTIGFGLAERGHVSLRVYDASGRLVATLLDEVRPAGNFTAAWDGRNAYGGTVTSGVYFYRLVVGEFVETRRMVLLR